MDSPGWQGILVKAHKPCIQVQVIIISGNKDTAYLISRPASTCPMVACCAMVRCEIGGDEVLWVSLQTPDETEVSVIAEDGDEQKLFDLPAIHARTQHPQSSQHRDYL